MKSAAIDVKTFSEARANLKSVMDQVVESHVPVVISRRKAEPVVIMSLADWNSWQETAYLNSTAANRRQPPGAGRVDRPARARRGAGGRIRTGRRAAAGGALGPVKIAFSPQGWADYQHWLAADPRALAKINRLTLDIRRSPFKGLGKPEPLKGDRAGWWSRRISDEHRLVYRVVGASDDQRLEVLQCRFHH